MRVKGTATEMRTQMQTHKREVEGQRQSLLDLRNLEVCSWHGRGSSHQSFAYFGNQSLFLKMLNANVCAISGFTCTAFSEWEVMKIHPMRLVTVT